MGEYPYSTISIVQGYSTGGMEYPTLSIIRGFKETQDLQLTIEHEVGHNWLYGILGSNERDFPWMDEGMNTYYDNRYSDWKFPEEKTKGGGLLGDVNEEKMDRIIYQTLIAEHLDQPISTPSPAFTATNYDFIAYSKTGDWMKKLETSLGQELFDSCMRSYFQRWQFKHPYPEDFRNLVNEISGRNNDSLFNLLHQTGSMEEPSKKELKIAPLVRFNEDAQHYNYLFISPALGYNQYDGLMLGGLLHNYTLPTTKFQFFLAPMYATRGKNFSGLGRLSYKLYPENVFQNITLGFTGSIFNQNDFTDSSGHTLFFNYTRLVPQGSLLFRKKYPRSTITHGIQVKIFVLREEGPKFSEDTISHVETVTRRTNLIPSASCGTR